MKPKIKVIIKRPDEKAGHVTNISQSLENLQRTVGGHIEIVPIAEGLVMICNEEGKLKGLERNFKMGGKYIFDTIVGDVIICGTSGEDLVDVPIDFRTWKMYLKAWGNEV